MNPTKTVLSLAVLCGIGMIVALVIGPTSAVQLTDIVQWFGHLLGRREPGEISRERLELVRTVVVDVRLPRVLLAVVVGAGLSGSGVALQTVFRNPLVDPYVLGLSAGAAFGAAAALAMGCSAVVPSAFAGGLAAVALSVLATGWNDQEATLSLVLVGVVIGGLFTAALTLVQFWADPLRLQTIVYWTMGNLHHAGWSQVRMAAPWVMGAMAVLWLQSWRLNLLALGDDEARTSGVDPARQRAWVLLPAVFAASASVAVAGIIGFYGLVIPHAARLLVGAGHSRLVLAAAFLGATVLLAVDTLSRSCTSYEFPVGVFTTAIGAPAFLWLLRRARSGWQM